MIEITVLKLGTGVHIRYGLKDSTALDMANSPAQVRVELAQDWAVIFGVSQSPKDGELTTKLACITSSWEESVGFRSPWQIRLEGQPWRIGEEGSLCVIALPPNWHWSDDRMMLDAPLCARQMPTFIEATRDKEIRSMLKLGRDSNWPLKITLASAIDEFTSLSVTYPISWEGIKWEDEEQSTSWCWNKFTEAAQADGLTAPPALQRQGAPWTLTLRKDNNAFRIIYRENTKTTP
jgi:hypothetical protein